MRFANLFFSFSASNLFLLLSFLKKKNYQFFVSTCFSLSIPFYSIHLFFSITFLFTRLSYLAILSFNCSWILYAIFSKFLAMFCHSLIISWSFFLPYLSLTLIQIFGHPFSLNCWFRKAFIFSFLKSWFSKNFY